ncbi:MAG: restriction endonuclease subunit S [bacterium]
MTPWKKYNLSDSPVQILDGDRGTNYPKKHEFFENGFCLFLNAKNVLSHRFDFSETMFISVEKDKKLRSGKLIKHDLVLTTRGTVGNVAYFGDNINFNHMRINSGMVILRVNQELILPRYFYYLFISPIIQNQIKSYVSGSAQPQLPIRDMSLFEFDLPPLPEQRRIAEILGSLDDKIELNLEMNKTLEQMAMLLYKRWFVDFEFPDSEGKPYKSNGGEMVQSELGMVPKDWELKKLGDMYQTTSGGTPSRKKPEYYTNGIYYWIKSKELNNTFIIDTEEKINEQGLKNSSAKLIPSYTVLIALYGATVGEMGITSNSSTCNQAVCAIIENEKYPFSFIFLYLRLNKEYILNNAVGSAQQNISQEMLKNLEVLKPSDEILSSFKEIINPIFYQIEKNIKENQTLSEIRDTLLPKLISGEVRVRGVEL